MPRKKRHTTTTKTRLHRWLIGGGVVLALLLCVAYAYRHHLWHTTPVIDNVAYPVRGIDVSAHNGNINWHAVADAGMEFAFVKATEGNTHVDKYLRHNCIGAHQAGLKVGVYHYFSMHREGDTQAHNLLQHIKGLPIDLPVVIDIEEAGQRHLPEHAIVRKRLQKMIDTMQSNGYDVIIYTNGDGYQRYYLPDFDGIPLWLSSFNTPQALADKRHHFHQFSFWGSVDGIDGDVDLDYFNGTRNDWENWLAQLHTPQTSDAQL